jgi:hypothetical protein
MFGYYLLNFKVIVSCYSKIFGKMSGFIVCYFVSQKYGQMSLACRPITELNS